ncbi:hypothetical protein HPP92_018427 [Vanilla planifolia]|uniref:Peptidase A1 domain-containing protein n=1 Tax=Vanilla planifolia TaxID=51239 RepID=A0A835QCT3_VANPL|nr:hypothetical protein HPP92_018427 [Vanilla planifolia]
MEPYTLRLVRQRPLFLSIVSLVIFIFPLRAAALSKPIVGFRLELSRVDATRNFSKVEQLRHATRRSNHRLAQLMARSAKWNSSSGIATSAPVHAGNGEFLMELAIGTPLVPFSAIVDTGSDLIWTQCKPCINCFDQPTPLFNPTKSSTYSKLPCSNSLCSALPTSACTENGSACEYFYSYGDSSSTEGVLSADTFAIGFPKPISVPGIGFGCGDDNQGAGFSQGGGLVGLGRGPLSLVSQLSLTQFSYCLTSLDSSKKSPLLLGPVAGHNSTVMTMTTKLLKNAEQPSFYYLSLAGISVGGDLVSIPNGTFDLQSDGSGGLIIDSGTSITYLEAEGYRAVKKAFLEKSKLKAANGNDVGLDLCFEGPAGEDTVVVPKLALHFHGGADLELPAENYVILDSETGLLCVTLMGSRDCPF